MLGVMVVMGDIWQGSGQRFGREWKALCHWTMLTMTEIKLSDGLE
jgi:hypothetical protein